MQDPKHLERYIKDLKQVYYLISSMQKSTDLKTILTTMLSECISITSATSGAVMFRHNQSDRLFFYVTQNINQDELHQTNLHIGDGIAGTVIAEGVPKIINDILLDPKYIPLSELIRSEMAVPIVVDQTVLGVIALDHISVNAFTDKHLELIQMICSYTGFIISHHISKLNNAKTARLLENMINISSIVSAQDIFKILTNELKATNACIINTKGEILFQEGELLEEITPKPELFQHSHYSLLKSENKDKIPYTRIVIPRIQKDMTFIADKIYYFTENVQIDINFADKILEFLSTKDSKFHHDSTIAQWAETKMSAPEGQVYDLAVESIEKEIIIAALKKNKDNRLKTAKFLGINRNTLRHKMEIFGLEK